MSTSREKVLIVDFNNVWNKYLYTRRGDFSKAIYATLYFFKSVYLAKEFKSVFVVLDGKPTEKYEEFKDYKLNRKKNPDKYIPVKVIVSVLAQYFNVVGGKTLEGDEVVGYLATRLNKKYDTYIYSNDKDFLQLMDLGVKVVSEFRKGRIHSILSEQEALIKFKNSKGEPLEGLQNILPYRVFKGDSSDGIPSACTGMFDTDIRRIIYNHWQHGELTEDKLNEIVKNANADVNVKKHITSDFKNNIRRNWHLMNLTYLPDGLKQSINKIWYKLNVPGLTKYELDEPIYKW